jgi:hypothetical protein
VTIWFVQITLENRKSHSLSTAGDEADRSSPSRRSSKAVLDASPMPPPPNVDLLLPDPVLLPLPSGLTNATPLGQGMSYTTVDAALKLGQLEAAAALGSPTNLATVHGSPPLPGTEAKATTAPASPAGREASGAAIAGLKDQSQELRLLLEQEIRTLENIVTTREIGMFTVHLDGPAKRPFTCCRNNECSSDRFELRGQVHAVTGRVRILYSSMFCLSLFSVF